MPIGRIVEEKEREICADCPYAAHVFVPGYGNTSARLVVIGRDAGGLEEEKRLPFVGDAGSVLDIGLNNVKLDRNDIFITNLVKCRPPNNIATTPEWKKAASLCRYYLDKELAQLEKNRKGKTAIIVPLGNEAMRSQMKKCVGGITQMRGTLEIREDKTRVMPTFHPAYILRDENQMPLFVHDLHRVKNEYIKITDPIKYARLKARGLVTEGAGYKHTVIEDIESFRAFAAKLQAQSEFTVDTETDGLAWWKRPDGTQTKIICAAFCFEDDHAYVLPFRRYEVKEIMTKTANGRNRRKKIARVHPYWEKGLFQEIIAALARIFANRKVCKTLHNAKFDFHHLANDSIVIKGLAFDDTMVMHHLVNENAPHNLKSLSTLHATHMAAYEREIKAAEEYSFSLVAVAPKVLYKYCAGDAVATRFVKRGLLKELREEGLESFYREYSIPLLRLLFDAERAGIPVDPKRLDRLDAHLKKRLHALEKRIHTEAGVVFNIASRPQLAMMLYGRLNLPCLKRTEKGAPSTEEAVLSTLAEHYNSEFCRLVIKHSKYKKLHGTYVVGMRAQLDQKNLLHTTFRQARTVSGRLSSSEPNLQNIPKTGPVKQLFVAPKGYKIIAADLSQAELRVMAVISKDAKLLKAFAGGADPHQAVAEMLFGKKDITPEERRDAKTINFGVLYGKEPPENLRPHFERFYAEYSKLRDKINELQRDALRRGYVISPYGRRRRFDVAAARREGPKALGHLKRQAVNSVPQGTASDINCKAAIRIQRQFRKLKVPARVLLMVHDSVLVMVKNNAVKHATKIIHAELTRPVPELDHYSFPIEIGVGQSWSQAEKNQGSLSETLRRLRVSAN